MNVFFPIIIFVSKVVNCKKKEKRKKELHEGKKDRGAKEQFTGTSTCGPVVKHPPCNAGDVGWIPGQGTKISHAAEQLSLSAVTRELVLCNKRSCMM